VAVIAQAQTWLARTSEGPQCGAIRWFQGSAGLDLTTQDAVLAKLLPVLRGQASQSGHKLLHVDRQPVVMEFVNSQQLDALAALGTSCPTTFCAPRSEPLILEESVYTLNGAELVAQRLTANSPTTARITPPTTSAASVPTAQPCVMPIRSSFCCRASAWCPSLKTRPRLALLASFT